MVVPGSEALDTTACVLATWGCVLDVGGGGKGCVFACLSFCHALFLGDFHWFSVAFGHGYGGVVGWQMVLLCLSVSSDSVSRGVFSVAVWWS